MAFVCTLGMFTACSSDDDDPVAVRNEKIEGTWNVEVTDMPDEGLYTGSVKINWQVPEGTTLNVDLTGTGQAFPMDLNTVVIPLANNLANTYLPQVLKSVEFTKDGKINAIYAEVSDDDTEAVDASTTTWKKAEGYATYKVVNESLINVTINADKATESIEDAEEKAQIKAILQKYNSIPVNIRWNGEKPYFFVDKAFVQPMIANLVAMISNVPTDDMDEDDLASFNMLKGIVNQLPDIMDKTTTFEAGLELTK